MKAQTATNNESTFSSAELAERAVQRRAVEAVIWGMPAVNTELMYQAMARETKGGWNQIVYWSRLLDWKNQTLTPNPDAIYLMPFFNTADAGPMVLDIPPADEGSITGSIMDCWQTPLEDVGPAGVDKGKGGKYLILPPGYKDKVPDAYIPLQSQTYQGYALLRSILESGSEADFDKAVEYGKRIKFYPLSKAANPPATIYLDAANVVFDATIPYDVRFFASLARMVESQPWLERDKAMIDSLKTLGIEKGKVFAPDAKTRDIMDEAAREALQWLDIQYEASLSPPFYEGGHWALPANPEVLGGMQSSFVNPDSYPIDGRGATYSMAFFCPKHSATGSYYLMSIKDKNGLPFNRHAIFAKDLDSDGWTRSLPLPLLTQPKSDSYFMKIVSEFEASLKKFPPIAPGTPDPYTPPSESNFRRRQRHLRQCRKSDGRLDGARLRR
jgi:hypothetical protein